ncbi:hypothetical protein [Sutcliffiella deserti]|uniref:hypothetical protein n=1 Tax=Sutcliffiella deserti TaxID=2875501 RepID=UPI001CBF181D|nr:hypothetical protein [Sutcliffiella deserti]
MKHSDKSEYNQEFKRYESIQLDESEQREVYVRLTSSINKHKRNRRYTDIINPIISTVLIAMFLLVGGYFVANEILKDEVEQQASYPPIYSDLEKQLSNILNKQVVVPYHKDYPVKMVWIPYKGNRIDGEFSDSKPLGATIVYKSDIVNDSDKNEEEIERLMEMGDIIYGLPVPSDHAAIRVDILNENSIFGEEMKMGDTKVYYDLQEMEHYDVIHYSFSLNHLTYVFSHKVTGPNTHAEAKTFVTSFLKQAK